MVSADRDPVVTALLRIAGDPRHWESLADVLPGAGPSSDEDGLDAYVASVAALAALSRVRGEGEAAEPPSPELGVVLVSPAGRVLACNAMAEAALQGLGDATPGAPLCFSDEANGQAVADALAGALRSGRRVGLQLQAPQGPRFASAVPAEAVVPRGRELGALLIFAGSGGGETWDMLRESFGLTEAELRLVRGLADGQSLQQAAEALGVSVHTVRNQLRAVFDKMGVQRQGDLLRAVHEYGRMSGALPARAAGADAPPVQRMRLPDGRWLAYREYGAPAGRAMLSFHEGMGSSLMPPGTDAIAREVGLRVLAPERPGFGQSDPPPAGYRWFEDIAEDMVAFLAERRVDRVRVGGILSGATAALHTAARLGDRAELVMLCSGRAPRRTRTHRDSSVFARIRAGLENQPWVVEALYAVLRLRRTPELTRQMVARSVAGSPGDLAWLDAHPELADYICQYVGECLARSARGPAFELSAFRRAENAPAPKPTAPVVVWHGAQGDAAPLEPLLDYLGGAVEELRVFDDVGLLLAPRYWPEIVRRFA